MDVEDGEAVDVWVPEAVFVAIEVIGAVVALVVESIGKTISEICVCGTDEIQVYLRLLMWLRLS